jgi:hypothetical protein
MSNRVTRSPLNDKLGVADRQRQTLLEFDRPAMALPSNGLVPTCGTSNMEWVPLAQPNQRHHQNDGAEQHEQNVHPVGATSEVVRKRRPNTTRNRVDITNAVTFSPWWASFVAPSDREWSAFVAQHPKFA